MKKIVAIFLGLLICLTAFVGCGDEKDNKSETENSKENISSIEPISSSETSEEASSNEESSIDSVSSSLDITTEEPDITTEKPDISSEEPNEKTEINQDELKAIGDFLNLVENNGFVSYNYYTKPQDVNLKYVFYDGAGIKIEKSDWAEGEAEKVLDATGWDEFFVSPIKIKFEDADNLLKEKCGISLYDFGSKPQIEGYIFVEEFNSFYVLRSDTNRCLIEVTDGYIDESGNYIVNYTSPLYQNNDFTVTLTKTENGYQFISNIRN